MRRISVLLVLAVVASVLGLAGNPASAAKAPLKCSKVTLEGKAFRRCRGFVKSKDGTVKLDTDITLPGKGAGPFPLIAMLHGLGGSKASYEVLFDGDDGQSASDTIEGTGGEYRYNNAWFASRGYAVLNYTARGWHEDDCVNRSIQGSDADPDFAPDSPACQIQLAHKDYEVKDTQYLIGRLVDGTLLRSDVAINRKKVGVTGVSYGGGQTWILSRDSKWKSPKGKGIALKVVAPIIGWTDMLDALLPNGLVRENYMPPESFTERLAEPAGVLKKSYIDRFYIGMQTFANVQLDLPDYIDLWYNTALEGEPYSNGTWFNATESLLANRSAYYIPADRTIPIVTVQGWNDHIFPVGQALSMLQRLTGDDPNYPIKVLLNDFGHPIAQNPAEQVVYQAYLINEWLDHYLRGVGGTPHFGVESFETVCSEIGEQAASNFLADTFGGLSAAGETFEFDVTGLLDTEVVDPHANALDPFPVSTPAGCRDTNTLIAEGNLADDVEAVNGFRMLGVPTVTFEAVPSASDMYVAFHLWDVSPDGETQALVDRGVVRLGAAGPQTVTAQLQGNNYDFGEGHFLKLELTANDTPSFRASNAEGTIAITNLELFVPSANLDAEAQG